MGEEEAWVGLAVHGWVGVTSVYSSSALRPSVFSRVTVWGHLLSRHTYTQCTLWRQFLCPLLDGRVEPLLAPLEYI